MNSVDGPDGEMPNKSSRSGIAEALGMDKLNTAIVVALLLVIAAFGLYLYLVPAEPEQVSIKRPQAAASAKLKSNEAYKVQEESVKFTVRAGAIVRASKITDIISPASARLTDLPTGLKSKVTSATIIARLDTAAAQKKVDRNKAAFEMAQAKLAGMSKSTESAKEDTKTAQLNVDVAQADLDASRAELAATELKAPAEGILETLNVIKGQVIGIGQSLGTIVDPKDYVLEAWVPAADAFSLHIDSTASVKFASRAKESYSAVISSIGMSEDTQRTGTEVPIRFRFEKDQKLEWLNFGLRGAVVELSTYRKVIPVPRAAVDSQGDRHVVYVKHGGQFVPRRVEIGLFDEELVEITDGLKPGEVIAVN